MVTSCRSPVLSAILSRVEEKSIEKGKTRVFNQEKLRKEFAPATIKLAFRICNCQRVYQVKVANINQFNLSGVSIKIC